ncbi:tyrosine-type recombinase/integrase [Bordetella genomosp. 9]|uniref:Integrase n=1 Tax=Bordetella genomosp. 9 TaxID=1416803 RepID=A0A1W6YYV4_9BORD|nr:site-specific integrase [Bordetella genomosp. 9]ARP86258.1 integrase [Bordetella genomosp. 9]
MASFRKRGDMWRAEVYKGGVRDSATFPTKREAQEWAAKRELELAESKETGVIPAKLSKVLEKYRDEVSPKNKGHRWERVRIDRFLKEEPDLCDKLIHTITPKDLAAWRDRRLEVVQGVSVRRDIALLRTAWGYARREWRNLKVDPWPDVAKPPEGRHRDRIYTQAEIDRLVACLTWEEGAKAVNPRQQTAIVFLLSLETAMRSGEIVSLEWPQVDLKHQVVHLDKTKNGDKRAVPLSKRAVQLFDAVKGLDDTRVFTISHQSRDIHFRNAKEVAGITDATFHDARATALTRLSKKLDILQLARMVGHRDPRSLLIYYRESAADIAKQLG